LIEIVRAPLLGNLPSALNWGASIGIAAVGWLVTLLFYGRYKRRIAYWL
jgi:ABC-type polysaccharide/polyol phosphate export permease